MTLSAHAIVGAGIVAAVPAHPILGICAAFASHFVLDAIPHWGYEIRSPSLRPDIRAPMKFDRTLLRDLAVISSDGLLGLILALLIFATPATLMLVLLGALAGEAPDTLHFFYIRYPHEPLVSIFKFHERIQREEFFRNRAHLGITSQIALIVVFILIFKFLTAPL